MFPLNNCVSLKRYRAELRETRFATQVTSVNSFAQCCTLAYICMLHYVEPDQKLMEQKCPRKSKRCLWNWKLSSQKLSSVKLKHPLSTLSTSNFLICQNISHSNSFTGPCGPLWANCGRAVCSSAFWVRRKWRRLLVGKQQPEVIEREKKKNAAGSRGKCRVHRKHCANKMK